MTESVDDLLETILSADAVDIVGVFPWSCASRLIELTARRAAAGTPIIRPDAVRYFTPSRETVSIYKHDGRLGTVVQRWIAGLTGIRNWLLPFATVSGKDEALLVYEFDNLYVDCVVRVRTGSHTAVTSLSQLPSHSIDNDETSSMLVIGRVPENRLETFDAFMDSLLASARHFVPLHVRCELPARETQAPEPTHGDEFNGVIRRLANYSSTQAGEVEPVAVVAICAESAEGTLVLLKERSIRNARDDFDSLSLISERVLVADLADALSADEQSTGTTDLLDSIWMRAGKPSPFVIPDDAFRIAAQRELFLTCGLDVPINRLEMMGTCLLDREGTGAHIGFKVFRLDLVRSSDLDELARAKVWNPTLRPVLLAKLYEAPMRDRLNRLLRRRDTWLRRVVLRTRPEVTNAD